MKTEKQRYSTGDEGAASQQSSPVSEKVDIGTTRRLFDYRIRCELNGTIDNWWDYQPFREQEKHQSGRLG